MSGELTERLLSRGHYLSVGNKALALKTAALCNEAAAEIATLRERLAEVERENTRLRAALAQSDLPCVYCTLPKEDWSKCQHGFPGCDRADDAMGCPELGASLRAEAAEEAHKRLRAETIEECAKRVEEGIDSIGALPYSSIWSVLKGAADHVRALAGKKTDK